jgi:hypothetical protein
MNTLPVLPSPTHAAGLRQSSTIADIITQIDGVESHPFRRDQVIRTTVDPAINIEIGVGDYDRAPAGLGWPEART